MLKQEVAEKNLRLLLEKWRIPMNEANRDVFVGDSRVKRPKKSP